jgi:hypothetical protein
VIFHHEDTKDTKNFYPIVLQWGFRLDIMILNIGGKVSAYEFYNWFDRKFLTTFPKCHPACPVGVMKKSSEHVLPSDMGGASCAGLQLSVLTFPQRPLACALI